MARIRDCLILATSLCGLSSAGCSAADTPEAAPSTTNAGPAAGETYARTALVATLNARGAPALSAWLAPTGEKLARTSGGISRLEETTDPAGVLLPLRADEPARVTDRTSGVSIGFTVVGGSAAPARISDGLAVYAGGGPSGSSTATP